MSVNVAARFSNFIGLTIYAVGFMTMKNMESCERKWSKIDQNQESKKTKMGSDST